MNRLLMMKRRRLVPGAVAVYLFNEGTGQILRDLSGNGYDGTLGSTAGADTNDPTWGATGLTFDGTDNYVDCGTAAALDVGTGDFTISAVVSCTNPTNAQGIVGKRFGNTGPRWEIGASGGKFRLVYIGASAATLVVNADAAYVAGTPYAVTATRLGSTLRLYIGAALQTGAATITVNASAIASGLFIGSDPTNLAPFTGTIHAATVYSTALTPAQVTQTYSALKGMLAPRGVVLP